MRLHSFLPVMALRSHMKAPSYKHPLLICRASSSRRQKSRRLTRESRSPVKLSESAKNAFEMMLEDGNNYEAVQIGYQQSKDGLNMVFSFNFLSQSEVEIVESRSPPDEYTTIFADESASINYKLYVHPNALMKVMGATVDIDIETMEFRLLDGEGLPLEA